MRITLSASILILMVFSQSYGIPRYSVEYNQSCALCHVDPSGGGARSLYGAQFFAYTDLAMQEKPFEEIETVKPMLNDQIQIGLDGRTIFFGQDQPAVNSFMQMQGDLYLIFNLSPTWTFYLDKGLYSGFEAWGMGHVLPFTGYVKFGQFTPPYGLRLADHNSFTREKLGFGIGWRETGVEVGFHPEMFNLAIAVTNGTSSLIDTDEGKAVTGRFDFRFPIGDANFWIGATGRRNQVGSDVDVIAGGFGGISLGIIDIMGEVDYRDFVNTELISFAEVALKLRKGLTIRVEHDFYDPNLDQESGAENMYLIGLEIVPTGYLQLSPDFRFHDLQPGSEDDYIEGSLQCHVFF
ncbi:hypothetical protein CEE37_04865 [candidate division LCP-89 bacterium B3_LCP]|uniref:Porin n=1 Tax=candidate division LCP-89 bacterium B3_LCP TaxID=2012998 RepID=A0A532V1H9_UNCL8|nr:MAG: hypothetical protein CEE37_04865 [candidate division LCP-89 bacterium B3_LCP]